MRQMSSKGRPGSRKGPKRSKSMMNIDLGSKPKSKTKPKKKPSKSKTRTESKRKYESSTMGSKENLMVTEESTETIPEVPERPIELQKDSPLQINEGSAELKRPLTAPVTRPTTATGKGGVKVVARFRPLNKTEKKVGSAIDGPIIEIADDNLSVRFSKAAQKVLNLTSEDSARFTFDYVFPTTSNQAQVFQHTGEAMIPELFAGFNCTIFAYGQTGTGKTWSMMGIVGTENSGVIPRLVEAIFEGIERADVNIEFAVEVSYVEIYRERIKDLLHPANDNLKIRENKQKGIWIPGVTETYATSNQEVLEIMKTGSLNRSIASTNMNAESSRSHSVFILKLTQKNKEHGSTKSSKLFLVDLAGSEKISKTGATGQTLKEAQTINKSLSTLGIVIKSLTTGSKHIPYRDSKLTRLLSDSLGGNSKTCLIITGTMAYYNMEETLSTMRFGSRAKLIKNKPKVNEERSIAEYKQLLAEAEAKIREQNKIIAVLKDEVASGGGGSGVMIFDNANGIYNESSKDNTDVNLDNKIQDDDAEEQEDVVSELNNTAKAQDLNATLKSQDLSLPLRRARRPSSINALMSLQAKYNTLEQQHDEAKEKNDELKDQLQDAKNDLENSKSKIEELQATLAQADALRKEAVDGITLVLTKRLELAQKENKMNLERIFKLHEEKKRLNDKLKSRMDLAESFMAQTKKTLQNIENRVVPTVAQDEVDGKGLLEPSAGPKAPLNAEKLRTQNKALMEDLAKKCADMIQMRMELEEFKNMMRTKGIKKVNLPSEPDELAFQKSLVATRDQTIELLEGALHDSNVFARKMFGEYEAKIKTLKSTVTRQRYK